MESTLKTTGFDVLRYIWTQATLNAGRFRVFARRRPVSAFWLVVIILLVLISIAAPLVAPDDPNSPDFKNVTASPGAGHLFGTDFLGRDSLSRVIYGGRVSLFIALTSIFIGIGVGSVWGMVSGYLGGKFDLISQRFLEILIAIPGLILAMMLTFILGASITTLIVAIAFTRLAFGARVIRAVTLSVRETAYVEAARSIGAPPWRIMVFHVAPQTFAPFLVLFTTNIGIAILIEAALGFIGLGIAPPTATWGGMLGEAATNLEPFWWLVFFPGLFITVAVLAFNLAGDGLQDVLDPRSRGTL
ncbi:MAG: ABC transporter permease [Chloroflexi bacterium]|nr:ABC transporter permease [Chloroflexota bacterium]